MKTWIVLVAAAALLAACGSDGSGTVAAATDPTAVPAAPAVSDATAEPDPPAAQPEVLRWQRANLGFVSAYVLARGNAATIVDTGVPGSAAAIGESLAALGLNYNDVEHVVLTHNHQDHAGNQNKADT